MKEKEPHPFLSYILEELSEVDSSQIKSSIFEEKIPKHCIPFNAIVTKNSYTLSVGVVCSKKIKKLELSKKFFLSLFTDYLIHYKEVFRGDKVVCLVSEEKELDGFIVHRLILELPFGFVQVFSSYEENALKEIFLKLEDPSIFNKKSMPISSMFKALVTGTKPESKASN